MKKKHKKLTESQQIARAKRAFKRSGWSFHTGSLGVGAYEVPRFYALQVKREGRIAKMRAKKFRLFDWIVKGKGHLSDWTDWHSGAYEGEYT